MDYTQSSLFFKLKKSFRYFWLYGLSRTLIKIKGQYHMKSSEMFNGDIWVNKSCVTPDYAKRNVAIIGCGNYAYSNIAYYLKKNNSQFLKYTYDIDLKKSLSLCKEYYGAFAVTDWKQILSDPLVKIVFIASNHASHAEYAIACIEAGKSVHIEKPHVVSYEQLSRLSEAMRNNHTSKVFLGFNRPKSILFKKLQKELQSQNGPIMINWFIAGHEISDDHWYFDAKEGGRVLGNLCHWTDLTLNLISLKRAFPCTIIPATPSGAKSDFVVSIIFADRSCATITFSAKGHTFEGVREILNVHKGDLLGTLSDFQNLRLDIVDKKKNYKLFYRDHGHETNILYSIDNMDLGESHDESIEYIEMTAKFFLAIREAIDTENIVIVK
jgi:predicted dehydrogenase